MLKEPRKRRTRQHVIADLGVHHVEGFILREGHTVQRVQPDYGYDLQMTTFDDSGCVEPGAVLFQCKASDHLIRSGTDFTVDIDIRDHNLWTSEKRPVILVVYDAPRHRSYWISIQEFFRDPDRRPKQGSKFIRVRIPVRNRVNLKAIREMRELSRLALLPALFKGGS